MGALGLFAINSNPNVTLDPRLYTLVFTLDCIAFASIAAAPTVSEHTVADQSGEILLTMFAVRSCDRERVLWE